MTVNLQAKIVDSNNQEEFSINKKNESMLLGCNDTKPDGKNKPSLSSPTLREMMMSEKSVSQEHSLEDQRDKDIHRQPSTTLNDIPSNLDKEKEQHHLSNTSYKFVERSETTVPNDQCQEGVVGDVLSRQGTAEDEENLPPSVPSDVLAKSSQSKEGTDEADNKHSCISQVTAQVAVPLLLAWSMMTSFTGLNFPGIVLPQLSNPDTDDFYMEPKSMALFVSILQVGNMMGSLITGQVLAPFGPRIIILTGLAVGTVAWLGQVFSSQLWIIMTCRVLVGCCYALVKQPTIMYMIEVAHESRRGRMVGLLCIAKEIGLFSTYILGSLMLTWRQISIIYACIMIPPMIGVFFLPSSPRWLTTRGRVNEAYKSLAFYRGRHHNVNAELQEVVRQVDAAGASSTWQQLRLLAKPGIRRLFLVVLTIAILFPIHGSMQVHPYLVILLDTPGAPMDLSLSGVLCSSLKFIGTIVHLITVDYFGRVPIFVVCFSFISVCTAAYGYYFLLEDPNASGIEWLPLISIGVMMFLTGTTNPIVDGLQGELIPNSCRAVSMPIMSFVIGLLAFTGIQLFPYMTDTLGLHAVFGFFTVVNLAMALLGVTAIPETRGLSLEAISSLGSSDTGHKTAAPHSSNI